ncbi:Hypothetical protein A7982_08204 [Minicystis rosea]|nr:Hypothetical protein A7982_08204 [Minicystis rosea]
MDALLAGLNDRGGAKGRSVCPRSVQRASWVAMLSFAREIEIIRGAVILARDGTVGRYAVAPPANVGVVIAMGERLGCVPEDLGALALETTAIRPDFSDAGFSFAIDPLSGGLRDVSDLGLGALFAIHESGGEVLAIEPRNGAPCRVWWMGGAEVVLVSRTLSDLIARFARWLSRPEAALEAAEEPSPEGKGNTTRTPLHAPKERCAPRLRADIDTSCESDPSARAFLDALSSSALVFDLRGAREGVCCDKASPFGSPIAEGRWTRHDEIVAWTPAVAGVFVTSEPETAAQLHDALLPYFAEMFDDAASRFALPRAYAKFLDRDAAREVRAAPGFWDLDLYDAFLAALQTKRYGDLFRRDLDRVRAAGIWIVAASVRDRDLVLVCCDRARKSMFGRVITMTDDHPWLGGVPPTSWPSWKSFLSGATVGSSSA